MKGTASAEDSLPPCRRFPNVWEKYCRLIAGAGRWAAGSRLVRRVVLGGGNYLLSMQSQWCVAATGARYWPQIAGRRHGTLKFSPASVKQDEPWVTHVLGVHQGCSDAHVRQLERLEVYSSHVELKGMHSSYIHVIIVPILSFLRLAG